MCEKDIDTLITLCRKLGQSICDKGTFSELQTRSHSMKWNYRGNAFLHKFPDPEKSLLLNRQYSQMRKNLRACGLGPPCESASGSIGSIEQEKILEEFWDHLGTDDEGGTPYGGDLNR